MKVTDDYTTVEGKYGYYTSGVMVASIFYFIPIRIGLYKNNNLLNGHIISKNDFVAKSGNQFGCCKGDIVKRFVLIPETKADDKLLHLAKSAIDFYYYICGGSSKPVYTAYTNFFGVEVE